MYCQVKLKRTLRESSIIHQFILYTAFPLRVLGEAEALRSLVFDIYINFDFVEISFCIILLTNRRTGVKNITNKNQFDHIDSTAWYSLQRK